MNIGVDFEKYEFRKKVTVKVPGKMSFEASFFRNSKKNFHDVYVYTLSVNTEIYLVQEKYVHKLGYPFNTRKILLEKHKKSSVSEIERNILYSVLDVIVSLSKCRPKKDLRLGPPPYSGLSFKIKRKFRLVNIIKKMLKRR